MSKMHEDFTKRFYEACRLKLIDRLCRLIIFKVSVYGTVYGQQSVVWTRTFPQVVYMFRYLNRHRIAHFKINSRCRVERSGGVQFYS